MTPNPHNFETTLTVPEDLAPATPVELTSRARRLYLARRRHELLAPTNALIELIGLLSAEEKILACERVVGDLRTLQTHARRMASMIEEALGPGNSEKDASRVINHDLRSLLTIILGYGDGLKRSAHKLFLDSFADEFEQIYSLGRRVLTLADMTVAQLRSPNGYTAVDDVSRYLDRIADSVETGNDTIEPAAEPGRVLVAEDNEPIRNLLCDYLRTQGHEAVPVRDGAEALSMIESRPFDLILTDIEMPRTNGFQVIERLKGNPRLRDIPVIVISGHGELDGIAHCIKMGAEDYLPKPFNQVILKARVDACLEKKRLRDRNEQQRLRYNDLLYAILPGPVVEELVETDTVKPRRRESVAVLFADIVGFTTYCDRQQGSPEVVVQHLRRLFETWEGEASALGVQKIKTIGDAFMAAGGLLEDVENPVLDCVRLGLGMINFTRELRDEGGRELGFNLRVGVHTGPVVSGVLGRRQSLFDIWGDTVNIAARLESHGKAGCVNLSLEAWERIRGFFEGENRSIRELKGKPGLTEIVHLNPDTIKWLNA